MKKKKSNVAYPLVFAEKGTNKWMKIGSKKLDKYLTDKTKSQA